MAVAKSVRWRLEPLAVNPRGYLYTVILCNKYGTDNVENSINDDGMR